MSSTPSPRPPSASARCTPPRVPNRGASPRTSLAGTDSPLVGSRRRKSSISKWVDENPGRAELDGHDDFSRYASESMGDRACDGDDARDERGNNSIGPRVSSGATVNLEWDSDMPFSPMQGLSQSRLLVLAAVGAASSVSLEADAVVDDGRTATSRPVGFETAAGTIIPKPDSLCERAARATRNAVASEKPGARKPRSKDVASVESREPAQDGPSTPRQEMLPLASVDRGNTEGFFSHFNPQRVTGASWITLSSYRLRPASALTPRAMHQGNTRREASLPAPHHDDHATPENARPVLSPPVADSKNDSPIDSLRCIPPAITLVRPGSASNSKPGSMLVRPGSARSRSSSIAAGSNNEQVLGSFRSDYATARVERHMVDEVPRIMQRFQSPSPATRPSTSSGPQGRITDQERNRPGTSPAQNGRSPRAIRGGAASSGTAHENRTRASSATPRNLGNHPSFENAMNSNPVTMSWQFRMKYKTGFMPSKQRKPSNLGMKQPRKKSSAQEVVQECFTQSPTPLSPRASSTALPFRRSRERVPSPLQPTSRPVAEYIAKPPSPRPSTQPDTVASLTRPATAPAASQSSLGAAPAASQSSLGAAPAASQSSLGAAPAASQSSQGAGRSPFLGDGMPDRRMRQDAETRPGTREGETRPGTREGETRPGTSPRKRVPAGDHAAVQLPSTALLRMKGKHSEFTPSVDDVMSNLVTTKLHHPVRFGPQPSQRLPEAHPIQRQPEDMEMERRVEAAQDFMGNGLSEDLVVVDADGAKPGKASGPGPDIAKNVQAFVDVGKRNGGTTSSRASNKVPCMPASPPRSPESRPTSPSRAKSPSRPSVKVYHTSTVEDETLLAGIQGQPLPIDSFDGLERLESGSLRLKSPARSPRRGIQVPEFSAPRLQAADGADKELVADKAPSPITRPLLEPREVSSATENSESLQSSSPSSSALAFLQISHTHVHRPFSARMPASLFTANRRDSVDQAPPPSPRKRSALLQAPQAKLPAPDPASHATPPHSPAPPSTPSRSHGQDNFRRHEPANGAPPEVLGHLADAFLLALNSQIIAQAPRPRASKRPTGHTETKPKMGTAALSPSIGPWGGGGVSRLPSTVESPYLDHTSSPTSIGRLGSGGAFPSPERHKRYQ